nr:MAG TPA: hypothetical protein [Caudoviricetes sp.]
MHIIKCASQLPFVENGGPPDYLVQYVIIEITYICLYTLPFENIGCAATDRKIVLCCELYSPSLTRKAIY